ncbi:MAG TPA: hypothetical protein VGG33_00545 [Polyangia bacterium]
MLGTGVDAGVGMTGALSVGPAAGAHALVGRGLFVEGVGDFRLDLGVRFERYVLDEPGTGYGPQALFAFETSDVSFGIWSDHFRFARAFAGYACGDNCDPTDIVKAYTAIGFVMTIHWSGAD